MALFLFSRDYFTGIDDEFCDVSNFLCKLFHAFLQMSTIHVLLSTQFTISLDQN